MAISPFKTDYFRSQIAMRDELLSTKAIGTLFTYEVIDKLEGGMGTVFICRNGEQIIALKEVHIPEDEHSYIRERSVAEITNMMRVDGHGCLSVLGVNRELFQHGRSIFIELPYCAGGSLARWLKAAPQPIGEAAFHCLSIAVALAGAHQRGVLHCDLKPSNILFGANQYLGSPNDNCWNTSQWETLTADFGLSWRSERSPIGSGMRGTLAYAAPEQLEGQPFNESFDIWAWGVIAFESIAGHPYQHLWGDDGSRPVQPEELASELRSVPTLNSITNRLRHPSEEVPQWLRHLILAALDPDPTSRPTFKNIIDVFRSRCSLTVTFDTNEPPSQWIGADIQQGDYVYDESWSLIADLTKYGWTMRPTNEDSDTEKPHGTLITVRQGWLWKLRKAAELADGMPGMPDPSDEVFGLVAEVFGNRDHPESIWQQLDTDPRKESYLVALGSEVAHLSNGEPVHIDRNIPRGAVDMFLTIGMIQLVNRVETFGRAEDLQEMARFLYYSERMGTSGSVHTVRQRIQAYWLLGDNDQCHNWLETLEEFEIRDTSIDITAVSFYTSIENYNLAEQYGCRAWESLARQEGASISLKKVCLTKLCHVYYLMGDYHNMEKTMLRSDALQAPGFSIGELTLRALFLTRTGRATAARDFWDQTLMPILQVNGVDLTTLFLSAEFCLLHGKAEECIEWCHKAMTDPCFWLPVKFADRRRMIFILNEARRTLRMNSELDETQVSLLLAFVSKLIATETHEEAAILRENPDVLTLENIRIIEVLASLAKQRQDAANAHDLRWTAKFLKHQLFSTAAIDLAAFMQAHRESELSMELLEEFFAGFPFLLESEAPTFFFELSAELTGKSGSQTYRTIADLLVRMMGHIATRSMIGRTSEATDIPPVSILPHKTSIRSLLSGEEHLESA